VPWRRTDRPPPDLTLAARVAATRFHESMRLTKGNYIRRREASIAGSIYGQLMSPISVG